jgi:hypothetical protein
VFTDLSSQLAKLLRLIAWVICLIVLASFAIFAVNQASDASTQQQNAVHGSATPGTFAPPTSQPATKPKKGTVHQAIDDASDQLTSPFSGIVSGSHSQWLIHGVNTVLALIIYGFGLGYIARLLRVRM